MRYQRPDEVAGAAKLLVVAVRFVLRGPLSFFFVLGEWETQGRPQVEYHTTSIETQVITVLYLCHRLR